MVGASMSQAGLNRKTALATLTLVVAAEVPDLDFVYQLGGPVVGFQHHRGWTHSLVAIPAMGALAVVLVWGWHRLTRRVHLGMRPGMVAAPVKWKVLYLYACLAVFSHVLLDYTTSYGIRPFEPFSFRWYSWDIVYKVEPFLWLVLGAGLAPPVLVALICGHSTHKSLDLFVSRGAISALLALVLFWAFRDYQHRRAIAELKEQDYDGQQVLYVSAYPYAWNPFLWHGVIETRRFYETANVDTLHRHVDNVGRARAYFKREESRVVLAAKDSYLGRVYVDWAKYPVMEAQARSGNGTAYRVRFYDLRSIRQLGASVDLDKDLTVVAQRFGPHIQK